MFNPHKPVDVKYLSLMLYANAHMVMLMLTYLAYIIGFNLF